MSDQLTLEELGTQVRQHLKAIDDKVSERTSDVELTRLVKEAIDGLTADEEFVRKIRFGTGPAETQMVGTRYARWGLSVSDVEWLYDVMRSAQGSQLRNGKGIHPGPSEELSRTFESITTARYLSSDKVREMDR